MCLTFLVYTKHPPKKQNDEYLAWTFYLSSLVANLNMLSWRKNHKVENLTLGFWTRKAILQPDPDCVQGENCLKDEKNWHSMFLKSRVIFLLDLQRDLKSIFVINQIS